MSRKVENRMFKAKRFLPVVGLLLFAYIVNSVGVSVITEAFLKTNPLYFIVALSLTSVSSGIKAYKWKLGVDVQKPGFKFFEAWKAFIIGLFAAVITPGRLGEIIKAIYAADNRKIRTGKAFATVFIDRVIDTLLIFLLAIIGIYYMTAEFALGFSTPKTAIAVFIAFGIVVFLVLEEGVTRNMLRPVFRKIIPKKHQAILKTNFEEFYEGVRAIRKERLLLLKISALTMLAWFFVFIQYYLLSLAAGIDISYFYIAMIMPVSMLAELAPISISGIGTRDLVLIGMFGLLGIGAGSAVAFSLIVLLFNYCIAAIGLFFWMKDPIKIWRL